MGVEKSDDNVAVAAAMPAAAASENGDGMTAPGAVAVTTAALTDAEQKIAAHDASVIGSQLNQEDDKTKQKEKQMRTAAAASSNKDIDAAMERLSKNVASAPGGPATRPGVMEVKGDGQVKKQKVGAAQTEEELAAAATTNLLEQHTDIFLDEDKYDQKLAQHEQEIAGQFPDHDPLSQPQQQVAAAAAAMESNQQQPIDPEFGMTTLEETQTSLVATVPPDLDRARAGAINAAPGAVAITSSLSSPTGEATQVRRNDQASAEMSSSFRVANMERSGSMQYRDPTVYSAELVVANPVLSREFSLSRVGAGSGMSSNLHRDGTSGTATVFATTIAEAKEVKQYKGASGMTLKDLCKNRTFQIVAVVLLLLVIGAVIGIAYALTRPPPPLPELVSFTDD